MSSLIFTGGTGSPYRPPCGGWPTGSGPILFGGCTPCSTAGVRPKLKNTTTVPNYAAGGATTIAPYTRPVFDPGASNCGGTNQIPCAPWPEPVPANTYAPYSPPQTVDFSTIPKFGFKNLFARKAWHGRFGFLSGDGCCDLALKPAFAPAPSATKYRTITWDAKLKIYDNSTHSTVVTEYDQSGHATVDRYSGVMTTVAHNSASGVVTFPDGAGNGQDPSDPVLYSPGGSFPPGNAASSYLLSYILNGFDCCIKRHNFYLLGDDGGSGYLTITLDVKPSLRTGDLIHVQGSADSTVNGDHHITIVNNNTIRLDGGGVASDGVASSHTGWDGAFFFAPYLSPAPPMPCSPGLA